jgi:hypothetical protein
MYRIDISQRYAGFACERKPVSDPDNEKDPREPVLSGVFKVLVGTWAVEDLNL